MKRRWWLAGAGVLALAAALGGYLGWRHYRQPREPVHDGKTVAQWVEVLKGDDPGAGRQAALALAAMGEPGLGALLEARKDSDIRVHRRAVAGLVRVGAPAVPGLLAALPSGRDRAQTALVRIGEPAVPALVEALRDPALALSVIPVLGALGPGARAAVPDLIGVLQDRQSKADLRIRAARALGAIGPVPGSEEGPGKPPEEPDPASAALAGALADSNEQLREAVAEALGEIGPAAQDAVPDLLALRARDRRLPSHFVLWALGRIRREWVAPPRPVAALVAALRGASPERQAEIARRLESRGFQARAAVPALLAIVQDRRPAAILATGQVGAGTLSPGRLGVLALYASFTNREQHAALMAAESAVWIDPTQARPVLPLLLHCILDGDSRSLKSYTKALAFLAAKEAVPPLLTAFEDRPENRARWAAFALLRMRVPAQFVPEFRALLRKSMRKKDRFAGSVGVRVLGRMGPQARAAVPDVIAALNDPDLRADAATALVRIDPRRTDKAIKALLPDLESELTPNVHERQRLFALIALADMGPAARAAVPALRRLLSQERETYRVLDALEAMGPAASPLAFELVGLLSESAPNSHLPGRAADVLTSIGKPGVPTLARALRSPNALVRARAAGVLARIGPGARAAVPALTKALADKEADVRSQAALALGKIGPRAAPAVPTLVGWLANWEVSVRRQAIGALGGIGSEAKEAVPHLVECLLDHDAVVRYGAAVALGRCGTPGEETVLALREALQDQSPPVRLAAADALHRLAPDRAGEVIPVLVALARAPAAALHREAIEVLWRVAPSRARAMVPTLLGDLRAGDASDGCRAGVLLVRIAPAYRREVVAALINALDADYFGHREAIEGLWKLGPLAREAAPVLRFRCDRDHAPAFYRETVRALRKVDPGGSIP
jgi:HEAT repeat protein